MNAACMPTNDDARPPGAPAPGAADLDAAEAEMQRPLTWGAAAMKPVVTALDRVAATDVTVLITGESGVGKAVFARALHDRSDRAAAPFVVVNCGALSPSLLESELFGHEQGAFTGADRLQPGCLEAAAGGTVLLDEIGELPLAMQTRFLRVLQERRLRRVGGTAEIALDVRFIAATHRDLRQMVADGTFRADLYHRLAVFPLHVPPLRSRRADLLPLAERVLRGIAERFGRPDLHLSREAAHWLLERDWPGNVRALGNALERAVILSDGPRIELAALAGPERRASDGPRSLAEVERDAIEHALAYTGGHRRRAADLLGIGLRTLYDKLKRYELGG